MRIEQGGILYDAYFRGRRSALVDQAQGGGKLTEQLGGRKLGKYHLHGNLLTLDLARMKRQGPGGGHGRRPGDQGDRAVARAGAQGGLFKEAGDEPGEFLGGLDSVGQRLFVEGGQKTHWSFQSAGGERDAVLRSRT
jgi:hypothetical protein